jgi:hypothetical protein
MQSLYTLVGYQPQEGVLRRTRLANSARFRQELVQKLKALCPEHVEITHLPKKHRAMLRIDNSFMVAVLLCKQRRKNGGKLHWAVQLPAHERDYMTLIGLFNRAHDGVVGYHLFSHLPIHYHRSFENDPWLRTGIELKQLSDFYPLAEKLWAEMKKSKIRLGTSAPRIGEPQRSILPSERHNPVNRLSDRSS